MDLLTKVIILIAIIAGLSLVLYFEVRYMRKKRDSRIDSRIIKDDTYNAIITTKAVSQSLRNRGCETSAADLILQEAELAFDSGSYSRTKELASRAKTMLQESKRRQEESPFESIFSSSDGETTHPPKVPRAEEEKFPENYVESRFMITNAQRSVDQAANGGRGAIEGGRLLDEAKAAFERKDYTEALRLACAAKRRAEGGRDEVCDASDAEKEAVEEEPEAGVCEGCGASLDEGDLFCGSCGRSTEPERRCPECGAETNEEDRFCRNCGSRLDGL